MMNENNEGFKRKRVMKGWELGGRGIIWVRRRENRGLGEGVVEGEGG